MGSLLLFLYLSEDFVYRLLHVLFTSCHPVDDPDRRQDRDDVILHRILFL